MKKYLFPLVLLFLSLFFGITAKADTSYEAPINQRSCDLSVYAQQKCIFYYNNGNTFSDGMIDYGYINTTNGVVEQMLFTLDYSSYFEENDSLLLDTQELFSSNIINTTTKKYVRIIFINYGDYEYSDNNLDYFYAEIDLELNTIIVKDDSTNDDMTLMFSDELIDYLATLDYADYEINYIDSVLEYCVYSYDTTGVINTTSKILESYYFEKLNQNFPNNTEGSCGYISLSILLSYYDIFYSGDIVYDEVYDQVMITPATTTSTNLNYSTISPGPSEAFHNMIREDVGGLAGVYNSLNQGLTTAEMDTVLNTFMEYFSDYSMAGNTFTTSQLNGTQEIINELNSGRPVVIGIFDYVFNTSILVNNEIIDVARVCINQGHALIAYGYEVSSNGDVYFLCHTGWYGNSYDDLPNTKIKLLSSNITGITLRLEEYEHVCSNSYMLNGVSFCPCINSANGVQYFNNDNNLEILSSIANIYDEVDIQLMRKEEEKL